MTYRQIENHEHEYEEAGRIITPSGFGLSVGRCSLKYCGDYAVSVRKGHATVKDWADLQGVAIAALNAWQQRGLMNDPDATIGGPNEH